MENIDHFFNILNCIDDLKITIKREQIDHLKLELKKDILFEKENKEILKKIRILENYKTDLYIRSICSLFI